VKKLALVLAFVALSPVSAFAADVQPQATATVGKMLYSADGKKLAAVYKVDPAGAPQILLEGKLVTIPVSTLTEVDGKVSTSLTKKDILSKR
jgi:hypothetical protein